MINIFDLVIVVALIACFIVGFKKGALPELVALIGTIASLIISFMFMGKLGNILCDLMPFFNFAGDFKGLTSLNILMYQGISFLIIFSVLSTVLLILLKISGVLQKVVNLTLILWLPSKVLGGLVASLTAYLCIFVISVALMVPLHNIDIYKESKVINTICYETPYLSKNASGIVTSMKEVYELGDKIGKRELTSEIANKKIIETMIKYKVVDQKEIDKLIKFKKLKV